MRIYHFQRTILILLASLCLYLVLKQRHLCESKEYDNMLEIDDNTTDSIDSSDYTNDFTQSPPVLSSELNVRRRRQIETGGQVLDLPVDEGSSTRLPEGNSTDNTHDSTDLLSISNNNYTSATENSPDQTQTRLVLEKILTHVCVPLITKDVFGYGHTSTHILTRQLNVPVVFFIIEIIFATINIIQVHSSFKDLTRAQTCINNVVHIIFWSISAISLISHRFSWDDNWTRTNLLPTYPSDWFYVELICYVIVALLILEIYGYEWSFYSLYIEKSSGVYRVMEDPDFKCSVYHDGVQQLVR